MANIPGSKDARAKPGGGTAPNETPMASVWPPLLGCLLYSQRDVRETQSLVGLEELSVWRWREVSGAACCYEDGKGVGTEGQAER